MKSLNWYKQIRRTADQTFVLIRPITLSFQDFQIILRNFQVLLGFLLDFLLPDFLDFRGVPTDLQLFGLELATGN